MMEGRREHHHRLVCDTCFNISDSMLELYFTCQHEILSLQVLNVKDPWVEASAMDCEANRVNKGVRDNTSTPTSSPSQVNFGPSSFNIVFGPHAQWSRAQEHLGSL